MISSGPHAAPRCSSTRRRWQCSDHRVVVARGEDGARAEERGWDRELAGVEDVVDAAFREQGSHPALVVLPGQLARLLQPVEELRRRSEERLVCVVRPAELPEEEGEIRPAAEAREVGGVVQADVEDALHAGVTERPEERLGAPAGEPDREHLHRHRAYPAGRRSPAARPARANVRPVSRVSAG